MPATRSCPWCRVVSTWYHTPRGRGESSPMRSVRIPPGVQAVTRVINRACSRGSTGPQTATDAPSSAIGEHELAGATVTARGRGTRPADRALPFLRTVVMALREAAVFGLDLANHQLAIERGSLTVGYGSYGRPRINLYSGDVATVRIGKYCSIAAGVEITPGGMHRTDWIAMFPLTQVGAKHDPTEITSKGYVVVGNDVWIGKGARLLSGVTVGDGAVIGAYAVVARSVRPYAVVVGNPAREVRRRFSDEEVGGLLRIAWWNWPVEQISLYADLLRNGDVAALLRLVDGSVDHESGSGAPYGRPSAR